MSSPALSKDFPVSLSSNGDISKLTICRSIYTQNEFDFHYKTRHEQSQDKMNYLRRKHDKIKGKCYTKENVQNFFHKRFPFIKTLEKYKWKKWFAQDFLAGIIVGIMHVPQGMAYSQLAGLRPVYGLYVSLFPPLIYFFLGTSKQISIGTMAIASLMTNKFLQKASDDYPIEFIYNNSSNQSLYNKEDFQTSLAKKAAGFSLLIGLTQLFMSLFNVGSLSKYLSDPVMSAFIVGASLHVFTSQIKYCFGINIPSFNGIFYLVKIIFTIVIRIQETNVPTFILTVICIIILIISKEILNPYVLKKFRILIPVELFIITAGILISKYLCLNTKYGVLIVSHISKGIPVPSVPDLKNTFSYIPDILITALTSFAVSISLANIFSKKNNYEINCNQELFAYGIMNIFSSFFSCFPSAASLSRSAVQESVCGITQVTSIISCTLIFLVLLFIGPLFEPLPNCFLASIILVSLKVMFSRFRELKELWLFSPWDFIVWASTFIATVVFDVEYGLIFGVSLSILSIILRTQNANSKLLGHIHGTDIYQDIFLYNECEEIPGIKIFRYEGSLYYASSEHFKRKLHEKINFYPVELRSQIQNLEKKITKLDDALRTNASDAKLIAQRKSFTSQLKKMNKFKISLVILDCSTWEYIDFVRMKTLNEIIENFSLLNIPVSLANLKDDIRQMLCKFLSSYRNHEMLFYLTVHDAVNGFQTNHKWDVI